jgi:enamine deaminase RidA (YjgF/YER057c/UK114 family)
MQKRPINPQTWLGGFHMNQAIEVSGGERTLYISGQTSNDAEGNALHAGDIVAQTRQAWDNIIEVLDEAGMTADNIVRMSIYTTDVDAFMTHAEQIVPVWAGAGCKPVSTLLGVEKLFHPDIMVELEVTAVG